MNSLAIVQARCSSRRFPGKVLKHIGSVPMILFQLERIKKSCCLDEIVLATSTHSSDDELAAIVGEAGYRVFRGSLDDVLYRFCQCVQEFKPSIVVRLTGDCPLSDPSLIDELMLEFKTGKWDYLSNSADEHNLTVPDGFDVEVFRAGLLELAAREAKLPSEREHVTPWFRRESSGLRWGHFLHQPARPYFRVTVDDPVDLVVVREIVAALEPLNPSFGVDSVVKHLEQYPELAARNSAAVRNAGLLKSLAEDTDGDSFKFHG